MVNTGIALHPLRHCINYFVRSRLRINYYVNFRSPWKKFEIFRQNSDRSCEICANIALTKYR